MHFLMPLVISFLMIGIAEIGDKTQFLTLSLASKYPIEKVIYGTFCASALIMFISVLLGGIIHKFVPMIFISILAGAFFIIYGLMLIAPIATAEEKKEVGSPTVRSSDPFWIVFGSFFLAEIGDRTQLAAFALTAKYNAPIQIWIGATLGLTLVSLFGIVIGNILKNYMPDRIINYLSGVIFIIFGAITFLSLIFRI